MRAAFFLTAQPDNMNMDSGSYYALSTSSHWRPVVAGGYRCHSAGGTAVAVCEPGRGHVDSLWGQLCGDGLPGSEDFSPPWPGAGILACGCDFADAAYADFGSVFLRVLHQHLSERRPRRGGSVWGMDADLLRGGSGWGLDEGRGRVAR